MKSIRHSGLPAVFRIPLLQHCAAILIACGPALSWGDPVDDAAAPGNLVVEPATLQALGFEWYLEGDLNRTAEVQVSYRQVGTSSWKPAQPLLRIMEERLPLAWGQPDFVAPNLFAGSVLGLEPGTRYEVRLVLTDPDGVRGDAGKTVEVTTRAEPEPASGGRVFHVYPDGWEGAKSEPAFTGLYMAYYDASPVIGGDHYNAFPPRVRAGDTILVHAGVYKDDWLFYGHELDPNKQCCGTTWDGTYYLTADGTADRPIAIKAAGDGEVVFDGGDNYNLFNVMGGDYHYFEGITFRNTRVAIEAGLKNIAGSSGLAVKNCRFEDVGAGIHSDWSGSKDFYVADSVFLGRNNQNYLVPFSLRFWQARYPEVVASLPQNVNAAYSEFAIKIYGSGHVVAHNEVRHFHDGIDFATYGPPDNWPDTPRDRMPVSNDIYNNLVFNAHDDCIEADGPLYNIRVLNNLCVNMAGSGLSMQMLYAGPAYFVGNILYNSVGPFSALKFSGSSGAIFYHNTFVANVDARTPVVNNHFRNNLILSTRDGQPVWSMATFTNYSSSDYNGFYPGKGSDPGFVYTSPAIEKLRDYDLDALEKRSFATLDQYSSTTGEDRHSVLVTYDDFLKVTQPDEADPTHLYVPEDLDFGLKPDSKAVNGGEVLPNINDGFTGKAPDIGALELGKELPIYGPRP